MTITVYTGCMKSGKSKTLIELHDKFIAEGKTVEIFMPTLNVRDGAELKSRAYPNRSIACTSVVDPMIMIKSKADIIIVDEYMMLQSDMFEQFLKDAKAQNREVIISGLDYMANGRAFNNYPILQKYCDEEVKLTAKCDVFKCPEPATMTTLVSLSDTGSFIEGNGTKYSPMCLVHWNKHKDSYKSI